MRKAFTLIELLLSAVVFALVGSLAMVTIATTVKLQAASRQSQEIALQASTVKNSLEQDLQHSVIDSTVTRKYSLNIGSNPAVPFISYMILNPDPGSPTQYLLRLVCSEQQAGGVQRLVRYTVELTASDKTASSLTSCDSSGVGIALGGITIAGDQMSYLTNDTTAVDSVSFKPVSTSGNASISDPLAVKVELTLHNSPALVSGEERVGQTKVSPLTFTYMIDRSSSRKYPQP